MGRVNGMRASLVFALAVAPASCSLLMGDLPDPLDGGVGTGPAGDTGLAGAVTAVDGGGGTVWGAAGAPSGSTAHGSSNSGNGGQVSAGESVGGAAGQRNGGDSEPGDDDGGAPSQVAEGNGGTGNGSSRGGSNGNENGGGTAQVGSGGSSAAGGTVAGMGGGFGGVSGMMGVAGNGNGAGNGGTAGAGAAGTGGAAGSNGASGGTAGGTAGTGGGQAGGGGTSAGNGGSDGGSSGTKSGKGGSGGSVNCDADGDGALATGTCGGTDCDDTNADVHPGQLAFFTKATKAGSFDYDCNGESEPQYASRLDCTAITVDCVGEGFADKLPPCGKSEKWARCEQTVPPLPLCEKREDGKQTMACR